MPADDRRDRVVIRPPERSDTTEFLDAVAASRGLHHPWVFPAETTRAFHAYVRTRRRTDQWGVLVRTADDDRLVGVININNIVLGGMRSGALGYYAFAGVEHQGLMTEGLAAVLDEAFDTRGLALHRLEANIQPANVPSRKLVERLGFRHEGFSPRFLFIDGDWRDHDRWAITADVWQGRPHD
ncbi:MAG: GNAT family protein [Actinomycetota bacterium]